MSETQSHAEELLHTVEGHSCAYCEAGTLERATYKGNRAAVCNACDVPGVQVW